MKYRKEYQEINKLIDKAKQVLIVPHINPDPDALASSYALAKTIRNKGKIAFIGLQENLKEGYNPYSMPDPSYTIIPENIKSYNFDLLITTDIGSHTRSGKYIKLINNKIPLVNLDHHIDNDKFGNVNIVDSSYSSTSELVYEYLKYNKSKITKDIASSIYTGIVADTGSFRYSLTTNKTHIFAGELLESYNIDSNAIYESLFENISKSSLKLRQNVISTLKTFYNGEIALLYLKKEFLRECKANEEDGRNLVNIGGSLKNVIFSIFINEQEDSQIKINLRSKNNKIKVNEIAKLFGGGGHNKAAGFILNTSFNEAYEIIKAKIIDKYQSFTKPLP